MTVRYSQVYSPHRHDSVSCCACSVHWCPPLETIFWLKFLGAINSLEVSSLALYRDATPGLRGRGEPPPPEPAGTLTLPHLRQVIVNGSAWSVCVGLEVTGISLQGELFAVGTRKDAVERRRQLKALLSPFCQAQLVDPQPLPLVSFRAERELAIALQRAHAVARHAPRARWAKGKRWFCKCKHLGRCMCVATKRVVLAHLLHFQRFVGCVW